MKQWAILCLLSTLTSAGCVGPRVKPPAGMSREDAHSLKEFEEEIVEYEKLKKEIASRLPPPKDNATPEEIVTRRKVLADSLRSRRRGAEQGDVFDSGSGRVILGIIEKELNGPDGRELRAAIGDQLPTGVPIRVNDFYPENSPHSFVPPGLLKKLPQLPQDLQYQFADRHLLLLDTAANLILDIEKNVLK